MAAAEVTQNIDPQHVIMAVLAIALIISELLGKTEKFKSNGVLQLIVNILKAITGKNKKKQ